MRDRAAEVARLRALRPRVLRWYRRHRRDLPWRRTADPYAIWVSEVMLQQTRVDAVLPYYQDFLRRFPSVADLAAAAEEEVLAAWSGLGYYRRARMLRRGALAVMERHGGRVPADPDALLDLPGVGRYTAGAIASISFGHPSAVVDGNVERVLGRWLALSAAAGSARTREVWRVAEALVPPRSAADWNQALMELGATVCTPRTPRCSACPARSACAAHATGRPTEFPPSRPAPSITVVPVAVAVCVAGGRLLLERGSGESPLRGEWDLPARVVPDGADPGRLLAALLRGRFGFRVGTPSPAGRSTHAVMRSRLRLQAWSFPVPAGARDGGTWTWVDARRLDRVAVSGATRKVLRAMEAAAHGRSQGGNHPPSAASSRSPSGTRGRSKA
jgi:A/G-specific adenine glycosylase